MILIDSNSLLVLLVGLINKKLISSHKRTSIYTQEDFDSLLLIIPDFNKLLVLPNTWTEVDNLLNNFTGDYKWMYIQQFKFLCESTSEKYLASSLAINSDSFMNLGLTDSLLIQVGRDCEFLITSDSELSDFSRANNIPVYDMVAKRNERLKS